MDEDKVKVDVIIVGGGPAGLAAAYTLAKNDVEVIVVERGEYSGSKNLGGLLYGTILNEMIPEFWKSAPIERSVVRRHVTYLGKDGQNAGLSFGCDEWGREPFNYTYTIHRSKFDRWFAEQCEEAGASLIEGMVVDDLIYEGEGANKKAIGVKIRGDEEFFADVVILADGTHSIVTDKVMEALNVNRGEKQHYALGVKETFSLPRSVIEDRFGIEEGEGVAYDFIGVPFDGFVGGGFIYTQKDTISVGIVGKLDHLVKKNDAKPTEIMDSFKEHPVVAKLLRGGELVEYGAHLLPEGGIKSVPDLTGNGIMIVGDAAGLVNVSLYKEGTNHAMESGRLAALTAIDAKKNGDFSKAALKSYETKMQDSIAIQDLKKYESLPTILDSTPELLSQYPARVTQLLVDFFTVSMESKKDIQKRAIKKARAGLPLLKTAMNLFKARKLT